jgi:hypothetical protein
MVVTCKICNKIYKTYNSWYIHNRRLHNTVSNNETQISYKCDNCNIEFKHASSCSRHKKKCNQLHEKDKQLENKITVLESKINELSNSITNNTIQYNTINIQQNNYIGCIPSQLESIESIVNIYKKITYEEYIKYIYDSSKEKMLYKLTEYIFATNKLNEYKNIYIPVFNSDIIYKYNTSKKIFVKCDKQLTLNMYMNKSMTCIENLIFEFDEDNYEETIKIFEALSESQRISERIHNENIIIIHNSSNNIMPIFNEYNKYIE